MTADAKDLAAIGVQRNENLHEPVSQPTNR
jgi:hypothetical protein